MNDTSTKAKHRKMEVAIDVTNPELPRIEVNFNMSPAYHYKWAIIRTARAIVRNPRYYQIATAAFECHKDMLRNKGVSEDALKRADELLVERVDLLIRRETAKAARNGK